MVMPGTEESNQPRWSVGALAKATGLTVRTLHHYDEIGLLRPSERTSSGHRKYTEPDLRRLYRIRTLRSLGLSLTDVGQALGTREDHDALRDMLANQLGQLDQQARRLDVLRNQISRILDRLDGSVAPNPEEILKLLENMTMINEYYTEDQLTYLDKRAEELGKETIAAAEAEWPPLIAKMTEHQQAGTPVDDPEVQGLTRRWFELVEMFTGGDPGIGQSLQNLLTERREELNEQRDTGLTKELWDYVGRAKAALLAE